MTRHPGMWVTEFANLGVVFGIVWNMTQKPGVGGAVAAVVGGYAIGAALALWFSRAPHDELAAAAEPAA